MIESLKNYLYEYGPVFLILAVILAAIAGLIALGVTLFPTQVALAPGTSEAPEDYPAALADDAQSIVTSELDMIFNVWLGPDGNDNLTVRRVLRNNERHALLLAMALNDAGESTKAQTMLDCALLFNAVAMSTADEIAALRDVPYRDVGSLPLLMEDAQGWPAPFWYVLTCADEVAGW